MSRRVLVVDNDGAVRSDLAGALERHGFDVITASRGDQAIELLRRKRPDAVILDLLLPGRSGFEVASAARDLSERRKKDNAAPLAVLAMSETFTGPRSRADAVARFDLVDLLAKPIDALGVAERLLQHIDANKPGKPRQESGRGKAPGGASKPRSSTGRDPSDDAAAATGPGSRPASGSGKSSRKSGRSKAAGASGAPALAGSTPTHTPFTDDVPDAGDLASTLFGHLLHAFWVREETGLLKLRHGRKRKDLFLRAGEPVHVRGNIVAECLGRVLARGGVISDADCRRSVRLLKQRSERQGELLLEMGAVDEEGLEWGLSRQLAEKLLEVFTWTAGTYRFVPTSEEPPAEGSLSEGLPIVISEGIRHRMPWTRVEHELEAWEQSFPVWGASPRFRELDLGLDPAEEEFFVHLDGQRTLAASLSASELDPEVAERVLLAMLCTRKVELAAERDSRRTARVAPPDRRPGD